MAYLGGDKILDDEYNNMLTGSTAGAYGINHIFVNKTNLPTICYQTFQRHFGGCEMVGGYNISGVTSCTPRRLGVHMLILEKYKSMKNPLQVGF